MIMDTLEYNGTTYEFNTVREWNNLKVIEADLPVRGCVGRWDESSGEYRIFINKNLSDQEKLEVFLHEMIHLYHEDFKDPSMNLQQIESMTHHKTEQIMKEILP